MRGIRLYFLRRTERKVQKRVDYYYDQRLAYAQKAYDIDQHNQPLKWGQAQHNANWCGYYWRKNLEHLHEVRARIKQLEQPPPRLTELMTGTSLWRLTYVTLRSRNWPPEAAKAAADHAVEIHGSDERVPTRVFNALLHEVSRSD